MNAPLRILCVDDNIGMLDSLRMGLESRGLEVVTACGGLEALQCYQEQEIFYAVVTDHDMPGMNGIQLVRALREKGFQGVVLIISGRLRTEDLWAYAPYAVRGFVPKPFEIARLTSLLLPGA